MTLQNARQFFENFIGVPAQEFILLAQSGSARRNYLASDASSRYVVTCNTNVAENESFFYFSEVFSSLNVRAPKIFQISEDRQMYVQQLVGEQTLSEIIAEERSSPRVEELVRKTLKQLAETQQKTRGIVDYSNTFEYLAYDELPITSDLFYFKSFIVDILEIPHQKGILLKEFAELTDQLAKLQPRGLMMRDFQARNIVINPSGEPFFIDYQAAMYGPLMYDVVSFLFQAKADFSPEFRSRMLEYYFSLWSDGEEITQLESALPPLQLIRFLQVLGAYGFRGLIQKKPHFMASLEGGIKNLTEFSKVWSEMKNYPELQKVILRLNDETTKHKIAEFTGQKY